MKHLLFVIIIACFLLSCSEDQFDFIGSYEMVSLRQECTDTSQNAEVRVGDDGVCLVNGDGFNCISGTVVISEDGTYELTSRRVDILGGLRLSRVPETSTGTYEIIDNEITLSPNTASEIVMTIDATETFLDWVAATTTDGCERIYQYRKSL